MNVLMGLTTAILMPSARTLPNHTNASANLVTPGMGNTAKVGRADSTEKKGGREIQLCLLAQARILK